MTLAALSDFSFETPLQPARDVGTRGRLDWIALDALLIDASYQRPINESGKRNIRRLVENFRWALFSPLIVAARPDGRYAVIDGQHRAVAAKLHGGVPHLPCLVLDCAPNEEARAFAVINGHVTRVQPQYMFRARLAAGEASAVRAAEAAARAGVRILPYPLAAKFLKQGDTLASATIETCVARYGEAVVTAALSLIAQTGNGNVGLVKAAIIEGFARALHANPKWLGRMEEARAAVGKISVAAIYAKALAAAVDGGSAVIPRTEAQLAALLRHALGDGKAPEPVKTTPQKAREAARAHQRAFVVTPPKDIVKADERAAIETFIAEKGVRRIETAATGNEHILVNWLQRRGVKIEKTGLHSKKWWRLNGKEKLDVDAFYALVDRERAKAGLEPLVRQRRKA